MKAEELSLKNTYFITGFGIVATATLMLAVLYTLTKNATVLLCGLLFTLLTSFWILLFATLVRKKIKIFSYEICRILDAMMSNHMETQKSFEEETLFSKINDRLIRLYEAMQERSNRVAEEKADLQELISDISHQVKMPIANLKMINATLLEQEVPKDKQRDFLLSMDGQLNKLDFLMQAMIKISRLETGVITLSQRDCSVYETLATALGGIFLAAEKKKINVIVDCPEDLKVFHDSKWTAEALFNILDNAVKYTASGGTIQVSALRWEMYTKIDIADTGKGIAESRQAAVFKRFYREEEVHNIEGIGIGLSLAREIITMQGGYIKLSSELGKGSVFSVFLPNE